MFFLKTFVKYLKAFGEKNAESENNQILDFS